MASKAKWSRSRAASWSSTKTGCRKEGPSRTSWWPAATFRPAPFTRTVWSASTSVPTSTSRPRTAGWGRWASGRRNSWSSRPSASFCTPPTSTSKEKGCRRKIEQFSDQKIFWVVDQGLWLLFLIAEVHRLKLIKFYIWYTFLINSTKYGYNSVYYVYNIYLYKLKRNF